ncbi:MAG: alpha/beta hydrolase [Hyphomonadaceae bacterium]|nr:alpha/beta hydrolase [Hyphomonadaceae bacterium]
MPQVTANGIKLTYESHGPKDAPVALLIMGLGGQLTMWPDKLVADLVKGGYRVITFDNRDIGLSHHHTGEKTPHILRHILLRRLGIRSKTPYDLSDMAQDTIGLMEALALDRVHLVGISMGGMIGQHVAAKVPDRVSSLTAIMTTTGNPKLPRPSSTVMKAMVRRGPQPTRRDDIIDQSVATFGIIGTPGEDQNTNGMRDRITRSYDRSFNPAGVIRQMSAIVASGDFRKVTRTIKAPTLVIHGDADPLVPIEGGRDIAKLVRGARMEVMQGMGHDVPPRFLPQVTKLMLDHFAATRVYSAAE